jgi:hypothetical protein
LRERECEAHRHSTATNIEEAGPMRRAQCWLFMLPLLSLLARVSAPGQTQSADAPKAATPILIELFTSEGCSSCPPADAWLQQLDMSQPIPGAQAIVLSEHVDYWDHEGWKDPFSASVLTDRQSAYVRALGAGSPYTPQAIMNGTTELRLSEQAQLNRVLLQAAKVQRLPVSIGAASVASGSPALLRAHIDADGASIKHNADIYAVIALDHAESQVLRGENGGRRLTHASVALDLIKIGRLEKGRPFSQDFQAKLKTGLDPGNLRLVVFVQEPGPGGVLGAALQEIRPSGK